MADKGEDFNNVEGLQSIIKDLMLAHFDEISELVNKIAVLTEENISLRLKGVVSKKNTSCREHGCVESSLGLDFTLPEDK